MFDRIYNKATYIPKGASIPVRLPGRYVSSLLRITVQLVVIRASEVRKLLVPESNMLYVISVRNLKQELSSIIASNSKTGSNKSK